MLLLRTATWSFILAMVCLQSASAQNFLCQSNLCDAACDSPCDELVGCDLAGCDSAGNCSSSQCDCGSCGSCLCRSQLFGDWLGMRSCLSQQGIVPDFRATQFYQGVTSGGNARRFRYGGKLDYNFTFLGKPLGLNEGFSLLMHAETRFGQSTLFDAAALAPSNTNMLMPNQETTTAITGFQVIQAFSEEFALTLGKINALDFFNTLYPQTGRGIDHFMNTSAFFPLTLSRTIPLSFLGAGALKLNEGRIQGALIAIDSNNVPTTSGIGDLFDNGANIAAMWRLFSNAGGRPGSHLFIGTYANGDYNSLDPTGWSFIPTVGLVVPKTQGSWSATYIMEQQLWSDRCNPDRSLGLYSQWGLADEDTSPVAWCMNVSLQGKGLLEGRENDWMGIGYFYTGLSDELQQLTAPIVQLDDVQGCEMYYNAAITPSCFFTTDLQFVDPAEVRNETAVVLGARLSIVL